MTDVKAGSGSVLPTDLNELMLHVLDRLAAGENFSAVVEATGITARVTEAMNAQKDPVYVVLQEGGSSEEMFVHHHSSMAEANKDRVGCAKDAYRTSVVIEVPGTLAAHDDVFYEAVQKILAASKDLAYAEEDGDDMDHEGQQDVAGPSAT
ncbi:MAG: hypothetical protein E6Q67_09835 [Roseateles sp.]|nr:MAG: hypothetical protein E6Q67_09835 [Roseateles sp.]